MIPCYKRIFIKIRKRKKTTSKNFKNVSNFKQRSNGFQINFLRFINQFFDNLFLLEEIEDKRKILFFRL